jgi:hypothetical protein
MELIAAVLEEGTEKSAARAAQLSGNTDLSQKYFGERLAVCAHSDRPGRPELRAAREAVAQRKS